MTDDEEYEQLMKEEKTIREKIRNGVSPDEEDILYDEIDVIRRRKAKILKRISQ